MTEQTIVQSYWFQEDPRRNLVPGAILNIVFFVFLLQRKDALVTRLTQGNFKKFAKEFVWKNSHAEEKDEKSISNTISLRLNKVFLLQ